MSICLHWCLCYSHVVYFCDTHTPALLEDLSDVSWLGLRLGTALPNHVAASKSSVYISNYIVACGVLERSGRASFHLCAVSSYPVSSASPSPLLCPYLFISLSLIFVVWVDRALCYSTHLLADRHPLNSAFLGKADSIFFKRSLHCPSPICTGSRYDITPWMHKAKAQSSVKDKSEEYFFAFG